MKNILAILILAGLFRPCRVAAQEVDTPPTVKVVPKPAPPGMGLSAKLKNPTAPGRDLGKWWKNSEIAKELEITPAQNGQIEQKFLEYRLQLIDLRAELEKQETLLEPMIEEDRPDEAKLGAQIDRVLAARGRLEKANAMMLLSIRRVLTVEQWHKLQARHIRTGIGVPRSPIPPVPPIAPLPKLAAPLPHPAPPPAPPGEPEPE